MLIKLSLGVMSSIVDDFSYLIFLATLCDTVIISIFQRSKLKIIRKAHIFFLSTELSSGRTGFTLRSLGPKLFLVYYASLQLN